VEYCQWEVFNASCPGADQLILMETARYGRMRFGRCMREDHGSVGCSADVRPYLDWKCSGRRRCQLLIPDAVLHAAHPCPKELMPYLEASYSCITGSHNAMYAVRYDHATSVLREAYEDYESFARDSRTNSAPYEDHRPQYVRCRTTW